MLFHDNKLLQKDMISNHVVVNVYHARSCEIAYGRFLPLCSSAYRRLCGRQKEVALQMFMGSEGQLKGDLIPFASVMPPWVS